MRLLGLKIERMDPSIQKVLYNCHKDYAEELYKIHLFRQTQAIGIL